MEDLPLLPGLTFRDITKNDFHLPQNFKMVNGYRMPSKIPRGVGGETHAVGSVAFLINQAPLRMDPALFYGRAKTPAPAPKLPHFALYGGKCLNFNGFFKESVFESPNESYRVRPVNIIYFLEDDTITVIEPPTRNAGFVQGRLIRRSRIPKSSDGAFWHWKDLNVGVDLALYGKVFHIVNCDAFSREYLLSQGVEVGAPEQMPDDPYALEQRLRLEATTTVSPSLDTKLRRFLEFGGKVLRFFCVWDDRDSELGELRPFVLLYFLEDDTISVEEVHTPNDGRDPCSVLLKRMRLPRDWRDVPVDFPSVVLETTEKEVTSYYTPMDLVVGRTIFVLGRRFLLYDCDAFTRKYYEHMLHITQPNRIDVFESPKPPKPIPVPPHTGFGSPEDAYQSVVSLIPKPPKKDVTRQLLNANKVLRYTAHLDPIHPEDKGRRFLLLYALSEGTLKISEPPIDNSGRTLTKFLKATKVPKPGARPDDHDYYTPADFYIGARVVVFQNHFIIDGCDLHVYRYMQDNPEKFPPAVVENVRGWLAGQGKLTDDVCARALDAEREAAAARALREDAATRHAAHDPPPPPLPELKTWEVPCLEPPAPPPCDPTGSAEAVRDKPDPSAAQTLSRLAVKYEHAHLGSQGEYPGGPA